MGIRASSDRLAIPPTPLLEDPTGADGRQGEAHEQANPDARDGQAAPGARSASSRRPRVVEGRGCWCRRRRRRLRHRSSGRRGSRGPCLGGASPVPCATTTLSTVRPSRSRLACRAVSSTAVARSEVAPAAEAATLGGTSSSRPPTRATDEPMTAASMGLSVAVLNTMLRGKPRLSDSRTTASEVVWTLVPPTRVGLRPSAASWASTAELSAVGLPTTRVFVIPRVRRASEVAGGTEP